MGLKSLPGDREIPWDLKGFYGTEGSLGTSKPSRGPADYLGLKSLPWDQEIPWDLKASSVTGRCRGT